MERQYLVNFLKESWSEKTKQTRRNARPWTPDQEGQVGLGLRNPRPDLRDQERGGEQSVWVFDVSCVSVVRFPRAKTGLIVGEEFGEAGAFNWYVFLIFLASM